MTPQANELFNRPTYPSQTSSRVPLTSILLFSPFSLYSLEQVTTSARSYIMHMMESVWGINDVSSRRIGHMHRKSWEREHTSVAPRFSITAILLPEKIEESHKIAQK